MVLDHYVMIGANIAFDLAVVANERPDLLPKIFRALGEARVIDILILQSLDAIAGGHLGMDPQAYGPLVDPATGKQSKFYSLSICSDSPSVASTPSEMTRGS